MNLLKSFYISAYMMGLMGASGYAGWTLFHGGGPTAWGGVLLTTLPVLMTLATLVMFRPTARTSARFPLLNLMGLAGLGLAVWGWRGEGAPVSAPALALAGWVGFLLYAYCYSSFGRVPSPSLRVGAQLPPFTVTDVDGRKVASAQLTDKPAILIFYRGNWCPLCMAQIKELVGLYDKIGRMGVRVALISPQPHANTIGLAKKYGVQFDFLTDEGAAAANALGIGIPHGLPMGMQMMGYDSETVLPTVVITATGGRVLWSHETDNYRIRPEPQVFLDVLQRHQMAQAA